VSLYDKLQEGMTYFSYNKENKISQTWDLGDIAPGDSKAINYTVVLDNDLAIGTYTNTAEITAFNNDPVHATVDLEVRKPEVLSATGFNVYDFLIVLTALASTLLGSLYFKRKLHSLDS
jgi:hypothetical protein